MKKILFAFLFSLSLEHAAFAWFIKTPVDPWKVTDQQISNAQYTCGLQLVKPLLEIPVCALDAGCTYEELNRSQAVMGYFKDRVEYAFGAEVKYTTRPSANSFQKMSLETYSPLYYHGYAVEHLGLVIEINKESIDGQTGEVKKQKTKLQTQLPEPTLMLDRRLTQDCHYDELGNNVCGEPYEERVLNWYTGFGEDDGNPYISKIRNMTTGIVLSKTIDFANYMACVENMLK